MSGDVSDRVPDLDLDGHFALGPWRVRRAGYGAMQLASDGGFGAAPGSRSGAILPAAQVLPDRVWWCRSCRPCEG
jgi:hypothetical protein